MTEEKPKNTMDIVAYGLTKREYFAALAMQGLLAWGDSVQAYEHSKIPKYAVELADALLKELEKEEL